MVVEQFSITGESQILTPDGIMKVTRRVMDQKPVTYKSHRLLMREIAKEWGFKWDAIDRAQQHVLERLFDLSPDIERSARKVREEDAAAAQIAMPVPVVEEPAPFVDPFDAMQQEMKQQETQRKHWRR